MGDLLGFKSPFAGKRRMGLRRAMTAADWYERGLALEASDPAGAAKAYERAIGGRPEFADAYNNLGRQLHDRGKLAIAESCYRIALCADASASLYWFNLGVVVEDQGRTSEAIAAYEHALAIDPLLADAHFNLARLYELTAKRVGDDLMLRRAVRHLSRYQTLARASGG